MKKTIIIIGIVLLHVSLYAQIEYPGTPWSLDRKLKSSPAAITFPGVSPQMVSQYLSSMPANLKDMVFAYPFDTLLSSDQQGTWDTLSDGSSVWRLSVSSPGALSVNLIFSQFVIPKGAKVYLYTPDYSIIRGAFTADDQTQSGVLPTVPVPGDYLTIELDLPAKASFLPVLKISKVSHDFKGVMTSGSCNVDINCPAGNEWQTEKRAVVKFIRGGYLLCTGALINNTRNDGRPFLLTANHTIRNASDAEHSIFFFRYESPTCGGGAGSLQYSLSGSQLIATTSKLDFCLVELSQAPPQEYDPFYAGWDRRAVLFLDTVTCIHHPSGDVKKISKSFRKIFTDSFGSGYDSLAHWLISEWDLGTTEGGSSGSPLFNTDHRIVGDLTGGQASCSYNRNDYFMKFSVSWDKYPDASNQLKCWLDPDDSGVYILNGFDPYAGGKPIANFSIRPVNILVGKKVYFTDLSTGLPSSWKWTFENADSEESTNQTPPPVKFLSPGTYHVTLHIVNDQGTDSLQQTVTVSDYASYSISENRIVPDQQVNLTDQSSDQPVTVNWMVSGSSITSYHGSDAAVHLTGQGEYSVSEIVELHHLTDTLIHYNQIKVIPDPIAFRSYSFGNVQPDEHTGYSDTALGNLGYLPGSNNKNIGGYAEMFKNTSDTTFIINGITIPIAALSKWGTAAYYLPVVIWNANKQEVLRDSILISGFQPQSKVTKWFNTPVKWDTLMYVGFEVRPWSEGTFISTMAVDRGASAKNTAYAIQGTQWLSFTTLAGMHTALDITLETSVLMNTFKEEIKVLPNANNGNLTIDLGNLIFHQVDVSVYNMKGQKIIADFTESDNLIDIKMSPAVSGVYLVRLTIDNNQFAIKTVIIR